MRRRRTGLRAGLVATLALALSTAPAMACRCVTPDPEAAFAAADAVVIGAPTGILSDDPSAIVYTFAVVTVLKGSPGRRLTIRSTATCRYAMAIAARHLLFLKEGDGAYSTNICSGNLTGAAADRFAAGKAKVH